MSVPLSESGPPTPSPASEFVPPPPGTKEEETHSPAGEVVGVTRLHGENSFLGTIMIENDRKS
jgi:hypothetical protein